MIGGRKQAEYLIVLFWHQARLLFSSCEPVQHQMPCRSDAKCLWCFVIDSFFPACRTPNRPRNEHWEAIDVLLLPEPERLLVGRLAAPAVLLIRFFSVRLMPLFLYSFPVHSAGHCNFMDVHGITVWCSQTQYKHVYCASYSLWNTSLPVFKYLLWPHVIQITNAHVPMFCCKSFVHMNNVALVPIFFWTVNLLWNKVKF